jgi:predicted GNAT family acetyltransferase
VADDPPSPDVRVVEEPGEDRFAIYAGDEIAGFTRYERRPDAYALMHTEIRPEFEHRGLATQLIRATLDVLAEREAAVLPYCPFVRRFIAEHREYAPLVPAADWSRFGLG